MTNFVPIPQIFLNRFDEAAKLASEGQYLEALEKYQNIFLDQDNIKIKDIVTGEFLATIELRKAYCLMDLKRYLESKTIFQALDEFLAGQLDTLNLYYFYISYGNTIGNLGLLEEMSNRMAHAMNIATEYLQDAEKFGKVWYWILHWEAVHQEWDSLEEHANDAYGFGVENSDLLLQEIALKFRTVAEQKSFSPE